MEEINYSGQKVGEIPPEGGPSLRRGNSEIWSNKPQTGEAEGRRGVEEERTKVDLSSQSSAID